MLLKGKIEKIRISFFPKCLKTAMKMIKNKILQIKRKKKTGMFQSRNETTFGMFLACFKTAIKPFGVGFWCIPI